MPRGRKTISVAPDSWRHGDLSSIATALKDPATGIAFAGNQIPRGGLVASPTAL